MKVCRAIAILAALSIPSLSASAIAGGRLHLKLEQASAAHEKQQFDQLDRIPCCAEQTRQPRQFRGTLAEYAHSKQDPLARQRAEALLRAMTGDGNRESPQANPAHFTATPEQHSKRWQFVDVKRAKLACQLPANPAKQARQARPSAEVLGAASVGDGKRKSHKAELVHWTATVERAKVRTVSWAYQACGQDGTRAKGACQARQHEADSSAERQTQEAGVWPHAADATTAGASGSEHPDSCFSHQPH